MKKNLWLLGLLAVLIALTWVFQEKRAEQEYVESLTKGKVLQGEITKLKLPAVEAEKREGQWWSGKLLLSHNAFKQLEKMLTSITSIKDIQGNLETFFKNALSLEVNGEKWLIGEMTLDKSAFYLSKGGKIYLVFIDAESGQVSTEGESIENKKLDELKSLLSQALPSLKENQFFRFYRKLPFERVTVEAQGNLPYELFLSGNKTSPPPVPGVEVHRGMSEKLLSVLTQITIKVEIPYSEKLKFKKLASMTFSGTGEKNINWQVWLKGKNAADVVILDEDLKRAFEVIGGTLRLFFLNVQDYWDKKVIPPSSFKSFERLGVTLREGTKEAKITVVNREPLDFLVDGFKVRPGNMQDLFQLIFNLGPLDQAGRISQLTKSEKQQFLNETTLRIDVMDQELICVRKSDELILVNLTQGFKAHFIGPSENLRCQFQDVLE